MAKDSREEGPKPTRQVLTKRVVDAAKPKRRKGRLVRTDKWDAKVPAFGLRIYPTGKKRYILRYRNAHGKERHLTLGNAEVLTVEQARQAAKDALARVARGEDPAQERDEARAAKDAELTLRQLADRWLEDYAEAHRRSIRNDRRNLGYVCSGALGRRPAKNVTQLDLTRVHAQVGKDHGHTTANRVLATAKAVFNKGVAWSYLPTNHPNPAKGVTPYPEPPRTRVVKRAEWPALLGAIQGYPEPFIKAAILVLLFSGMRKNDVLALRWDQVDLAGGFIHMSSQKTGVPRMVPISEATRRVLEALPRYEGNPHVFCGRKKGDHLKELKSAWEAIRTQAGCPDLRLHDFKRTVGTMLALGGEGAHVIQAVLGHKTPRTAEYYVKISAEMVSGVMDRYAGQVESLANEKDPSRLPPGPEGT